MKNRLKNVLGALILLAGGAAYWHNSQGEKAINAYLDGVRPHLIAGDEIHNRFVEFAQQSDEQQWVAELPSYVAEYRAVNANIQAVQTDDSEVSAMRDKMNLYASKRLEWYEQLEAQAKGAPEENLDHLIDASNQALDDFVSLKAAYFEKYNLEEVGG